MYDRFDDAGKIIDPELHWLMYIIIWCIECTIRFFINLFLMIFT